MKLLRGLVGAIAGFLVAVLANSFFVMSVYAVRGDSVDGVVAGLAVLMFLSTGLLGGYLAGLVARPVARQTGLVAAGLVAAAGALGIAMGAAVEPLWHQVLSIVLQAPAIMLGARAAIPRRNF